MPTRDGIAGAPTFDDSVAPLLPLLRCAVCASRDRLSVETGLIKADIRIQLHDEHLVCSGCRTQYPISADMIPIMWDVDVQRVFSRSHDSDAESLGALGANIAIYDSISDDYILYSRGQAVVRQKMQSAASKAIPAAQGPRGYHLDFGCGPGHVMEWLKDLEFRQIGLDISLNNLRNARRLRGCLVVCGNACNMPFADETMDLVTESSALHHILHWQSAVKEALRICKRPGGVVLDAEPTKAQMALSPLAVRVFNARFRVYQLLSYFMREKYVFRDVVQARLNVQAEIHHQPGTGFPLPEIELLFEHAGFDVDIVLSPSADAVEQANPNWKEILLSVLSARNPWNPEYGNFTAIGRAPARA